MPTAALPLWHALLLVVPAVAAFVAALAARRARSVASAWAWAGRATEVMLVAAVAVAVLRAATDARSAALLRADTVGAAMLMLVALVAWTVVRYSRQNLAGDPFEQRYVTWLLLTVTSVAVVVVANDLVVLALAWTATSLALHHLLTFFGDRPAAVATAHKKFVLGRCADACMVGAIVAFVVAFDTTRLDAIAADAIAAGTLPAAARVGVALVAVVAVLKCAQVPFHGWLIQVMEAPTPVSALLHAGVVNLGGFVLLRVAPVVDRAVETRTLLVVAGTATAVVAAMVMTTRISIKVSLAWSTCAQMGFMLVQCGLGLWEMALLHLLAHSVYKAHAFLSAGGTVRETQRKQLGGALPVPSAGSFVAAAAVALVSTGAVALVWERLPGTSSLTPAVWVMAGIVALAVVPLLRSTGARAVDRTTVVGAVAVPAVYLALHEVAGRLVPHGTEAPVALLVVVSVAFAALFAVQTLCTTHPSAPLVRRMYPWVYGGLFLDEAFTRVAFAAWPPPSPQPRPSVMATPSSIGALS